MRILIVAATAAEIQALISDFGFSISESKKGCDLYTLDNQKNNSEIENPKSEILITGVGMVATAFALGNHLATNKYDLVINLGIAGSFDHSIALGDVVEITDDTFAELGAEDDEAFLSLDELGLGETTFKPNGHPFINIKQVSAITVNKVHGNETSIQKVVNRLNPQVESMEGAAVFHACRQAGVACMQIRSVSNYVEKRNRDVWKIGLAIKNLNTFAGDLLQVLADK